MRGRNSLAVRLDGGLITADQPLTIIGREAANLNVVLMPNAKKSFDDQKIAETLRSFTSGRWARVTFLPTCVPKDIELLYDMQGRGFVQFARRWKNRKHLQDVYLAKNGWGDLSRSFLLVAGDVSSISCKRHFETLAKRLEWAKVY